MKKIIWITWVTLAMIGLLLGSRAAAQQPTAIQPEATLQQSGEYVPCESCDLDGGTCNACALGPCCAVCGGGCCCPDDWYFKQGIRILSRSKPRGIGTTWELNGTTGVFATKMDTRGIGFDSAAGYTATIGHYLGRDTDNRDHFVEFTYWGMNAWSDSQTAYGDRIDYVGGVTAGNLFSQFEESVGGFNRAEEQVIWYKSQMNNYEVNVRLRPRGREDRLVLHSNGRWRRECQPGDYTSYLIGLRTLSIDERFYFRSSGMVDDNGVQSNVNGDYDIDTHNDLFGFQIGGDYIHRQCKWQWGFRGKTGLFMNFADQNSRILTSAPGDPFATTQLNIADYARRDVISLLAEVGFVGNYKIRPNIILSAGYDLMWVTGLALAPEQLTFDTVPTNEINKNGHVYSHGLTLELEWTW